MNETMIEFTSAFMSMDEMSMLALRTAINKYSKLAFGYGAILFLVDTIANITWTTATQNDKSFDWPRFAGNMVLLLCIPIFALLISPVNKFFEYLYLDMSEPVELSIAGETISSDVNWGLNGMSGVMETAHKIHQARQDSAFNASGEYLDIIPDFESMKNAMISGAQTVVLTTTKTLNEIIGTIIEMYNVALFRILYLLGPFALMFSMIFKNAWLGWFKAYLVALFVMSVMEIIHLVVNISLKGSALNNMIGTIDTQVGFGILIGASLMYVILFLFVYSYAAKAVGGGDDAGRPTQVLGSLAMTVASFGMMKAGMTGPANALKSSAKIKTQGDEIAGALGGFMNSKK